MKTMNMARFHKLLNERYKVCQKCEDDKTVVYLNNLSDFVKQFFNLKGKFSGAIAPLSALETELLRDYYGVYHYGICKTKAELADDFSVSSAFLTNAFNNINYMLSCIMFHKKNNYKGVTIFDALPQKKNLINESIGNLTLKMVVRKKLIAANIFTYGDLLRYTKRNLSEIIDKKTLEYIVSSMHENGLIFIDELSFTDKQILFINLPQERVLSTDISWLELSKKLEIALRHSNINTIGEAIMCNNDLCNNELQKTLWNYGFVLNSTDTLDNSDKIEMVLDYPIDVLGFSLRTYNSLGRMGVKTLRQLIALSPSQIINQKNMGVMRYKEILEVIQNYGLSLANDDAEIISDALFDQKLVIKVKTQNKHSHLNDEDTNVQKYVSPKAGVDIKEIIEYSASNNPIPIEVLKLSNATYNVLKRLGINSVGQLTCLKPSQLRSQKNIGDIKYQEIVNALEQMGLQLASERLETSYIRKLTY